MGEKSSGCTHDLLLATLNVVHTSVVVHKQLQSSVVLEMRINVSPTTSEYMTTTTTTVYVRVNI